MITTQYLDYVIEAVEERNMARKVSIEENNIDVGPLCGQGIIIEIKKKYQLKDTASLTEAINHAFTTGYLKMECFNARNAVNSRVGYVRTDKTYEANYPNMECLNAIIAVDSREYVRIDNK